MITKERYDMLLDAYLKGANLAPIDFQNMEEYEQKHYSGLGVRVYPQKRPVEIRLLYETDLEGQEVFAGVSLYLKDEAPIRPIAEYEEMAKKGEENGVMSFAPGALRRITYERYMQEYGEEEVA